MLTLTNQWLRQQVGVFFLFDFPKWETCTLKDFGSRNTRVPLLVSQSRSELPEWGQRKVQKLAGVGFSDRPVS